MITTSTARTTPDGVIVAPVLLRVPRPAPLVAAGIFMSMIPAFALTAVRPKQAPAQLQTASDVFTAVIVLGHPVEALMVSRAARRAGVAPGERRRLVFSTLASGVFTSIRALWVLRRYR